MTKKDLLDNLLTKNGGVIKTSDAVAAGISRPYFLEYVKEKDLEKMSQGIYVSKEAWPDYLYLLQMRFKRIIYSHETALYLHGLAEREPLQYTVTTAANYHTAALKEQGVKVYFVKKELYDVGVCSLNTPFGHDVAVYDAERTLCDLIRSKKNIEVQDFSTAFKEYTKRKDKNIPLLMRYANIFNVEKTLRQYLEVLL